MRHVLITIGVVVTAPAVASAERDEGARPDEVPLARDEATRPAVGVGAGLLFGGDIGDGPDGGAQGNAGILAGVHASWTPITIGRFALGIDGSALRWTSEIAEADDTLALLGGRFQGQIGDRSALYVAARGGIWVQRIREAAQAGVGGYTHVGKSTRVRFGWELGVTAWREDIRVWYRGDARNTSNMYEKDEATHEPLPDYPLAGPHAWFELSVDL